MKIIEIKFTPKTNVEIEKFLDLYNLPLVNVYGWPIANDHFVSVLLADNDKAEHETLAYGPFDGRVDSTNARYLSIPRREYHGRFGVHFTTSFKAPGASNGNHVAIALGDNENEFLRLERFITDKYVDANNDRIKIHDTRGIIHLDKKQLAGNRFSKMDVEVHKGNHFYSSPPLSRGCPTVDHKQYDLFIRQIELLVMNLSIELIRGASIFRVTIDSLPAENDFNYSLFFKIRNALEKAKAKEASYV